jgi:hypothetical protein
MKFLAPLLMAFALAFPSVTLAAPLPLFSGDFSIVPEACQACPCGLAGILQLVQNLMNVMVSLAIVVLVLLIAYAGALFLFGASNPEARSQGKKLIMNAVVGFVIVLSAWLVIDFVMKTLYDGQKSGWGPWNEIIAGKGAWCITPTRIDELYAPPSGKIDYDKIDFDAPGTAGVGLSASAAKQKAQAVTKYRDAVCAAATQNGIAGECNRLLAIMAQESSGNPNAQSNFRRDDGTYGHAYGLMQMLPGTARDLDPSLKNLSDAAIGQKLKSDQNLSIRLGVKYYADQYKKFKSATLATAAYNGGPGSNQASKDCSGQTIWQCTTNSGYQQTRDYVVKVDDILKALGS